MSKLIKPRHTGFTVTSNKIIRDASLSWKARGIFTYLWSQPKDWDFYETEVMRHATDGRDGLRSGLKELETAGYLKRLRTRNENGQLSGSDWEISDEPMLASPVSDKPMLENPMLDEGTLLNTNPLSTNQLNTNNTKDTLSGKPDLTWVVAVRVISHLNEKTGRHFRDTPTNRRLIMSRVKEGFTEADCMQVIDNKVADWKNDSKYSQYLRPATLFNASKFEGYLNEPKHEEVKGYGGLDF